MSDSVVDKTKLVMCWHMHQPNYVDSSTNTYILPWTYLHAIKDYVDMAAHIEACASAKAVVNFAPVLLEQLADYADKIDQWSINGTEISDPMLDALVSDDMLPCFSNNHVLLSDCLRVNEKRLVNRYSHFAKLFKIAQQFAEEDALSNYFSEQFVCDLLVWYNLSWIAETEKRENEFVKALVLKEKNFTLEDRRQLVLLMGDLIRGVIPRYKKLAEEGKVELSFSPYAHPIVPLMNDFSVAREASPEMILPETKEYSGGKLRSRWHIQKGKEVFESYFGFSPRGCWPSEGGVCDESISMYADEGVEWVASGETVLRNSLSASGIEDDQCIHQAFQLKGLPTFCFFRDDGLSDMIGFDYSNWHADDAINNLVHHIETISATCPDKENTVISIIMDGENAWEYYPENAYYFLSQLYEKLSSSEVFELTTYSALKDAKIKTEKLDKIISGSWVYGTFSTWIGDPEKNRAWDLLCEAKTVYDNKINDSRLSESDRRKVTQQLAICEGSDWFWWFGDYNPADSVNDFDKLFRTHLSQLYLLLGEPVPESLAKVISVGGGAPAAGGVMRHGSDCKE